MSQETVKQLEEEGEVGADYLEELLDIADLGGDIDIDVDHGRASVAIIPGEDGDERELATLVGRDPPGADPPGRTGPHWFAFAPNAGHRWLPRGAPPAADCYRRRGG